MTVNRMDHVGVIVSDLDATIAFFTELGLNLQGRMTVDGKPVARIVGLDESVVKSDVAMMRTPDGHGCLELIRYHTPSTVDGAAAAPANARGLRHLAFEVDDIEDTLARLRSHGAELVGELVNYEDVYHLCYLRGPEGIIVELAQPVSAGGEAR